MLLTVEKFCQAVQIDMNGLLNQLQIETSRNMTPNERAALSSSYKAVSNLFGVVMKQNPQFSQVNISTSNMFLEYKLPSASSWCDLVLIGDNTDDKHNVIVIELKDWLKNSNDLPSQTEGLIVHDGIIHLHPSDQVRGYTEYCQRFHSAVLDYNATVSGLVFFTQDIDLIPYCSGGNVQLTQNYPVFNTTTTSVRNLSNNILSKINKPNQNFADDFKNGYYKQDRDILRQVADLLQGCQNQQGLFKIVNPFVLLEEQRKGYNQVMSTLDQMNTHDSKRVMIIIGPPGSGKSAIAVNVWIQAALKYHLSSHQDFLTEDRLFQPFC